MKNQLTIGQTVTFKSNTQNGGGSTDATYRGILVFNDGYTAKVECDFDGKVRSTYTKILNR